MQWLENVTSNLASMVIYAWVAAMAHGLLKNFRNAT